METVLRRLVRFTRQFIDWMLVGAMGALLVVVTIGMATRYVLPGWFVWTDELTRFGLVWVTFIGAAAALHRNMHLAVDVLLSRCRPLLRDLLVLLSDLMVVLFCALILPFSVRLVQMTHTQVSPALRVPMSLVYLVIPASAALMAGFTLVAIAEHIRRVRKRGDAR